MAHTKVDGAIQRARPPHLVAQDADADHCQEVIESEDGMPEASHEASAMAALVSVTQAGQQKTDQ